MERGRDEHHTDGAAQGVGGVRDFEVDIGYDRQSNVYYVISSDIPGLNIETTTFESLVEIAIDVAPDLLGASDEPTRITFKRAVRLMA